jgi:outer membrane phospholipase A
VGWIRHESTGEDGNGSRAWNTTYIEPTWVFNDFTFAPKIWAVFWGLRKGDVARDNTDIFYYLGCGEEYQLLINRTAQIIMAMNKRDEREFVTAINVV